MTFQFYYFINFHVKDSVIQQSVSLTAILVQNAAKHNRISHCNNNESVYGKGIWFSKNNKRSCLNHINTCQYIFKKLFKKKKRQATFNYFSISHNLKY
ncbi:hypothetical protein BpHYR1_016957 [Brachionus plicatilis]|uniref:Uncharacterized protein n=1 Tax=Brachionus plicatilis TaxID=10195 RepID=A0A3M7SS54_BRAPC|nr:hypothetical protein BpHYR1_016957 [Brachionus plicatilis]